MKLPLLPSIVLVSLLLSSCSSSTDTNVLPEHFEVTNPKLGSTYVYKPAAFDSVGNAISDGVRTDTIVTAIATDTTMMGRSHVWWFLSGERPGSSSSGTYYALSYLETGDLEYHEDGLEYVADWIRLPIATHRESIYLFDTNFDDHGKNYHELDTVRVNYVSNATLAAPLPPLQAIRLTVDFSIHIESLSDHVESITHTMRTMDFVPAIGFFSNAETIQTFTEQEHHSFYHDRMTLERYELK